MESRSEKFIDKTHETVMDIFKKTEKCRVMKDITDEELTVIYGFGLALQVLAEEEFESKHPDGRHDIYKLFIDYIDGVWGDEW